MPTPSFEIAALGFSQAESTLTAARDILKRAVDPLLDDALARGDMAAALTLVNKIPCASLRAAADQRIRHAPPMDKVRLATTADDILRINRPENQVTPTPDAVKALCTVDLGYGWHAYPVVPVYLTQAAQWAKACGATHYHAIELYLTGSCQKQVTSYAFIHDIEYDVRGYPTSAQQVAMLNMLRDGMFVFMDEPRRYASPLTEGVVNEIPVN